MVLVQLDLTKEEDDKVSLYLVKWKLASKKEVIKKVIKDLPDLEISNKPKKQS
jgi:hypothetical protein